MSKIKIISDSTCDLSPDIIEKHGISIVPLYINLGGKALRDIEEVTPEDIFDFVGKTGTLPGTIACSAEDYKNEFGKWRKEGYEIICCTISGEMSSSFQNAGIAAAEVGGTWVVDSRNLSTGVGHIVLNAALMAESGMEAPDIVSALNALVPKVRSSFILGDLEYMKKGGRCSGAAALGANLLKIKPAIIVENGVMKLGRKYRGPLDKVLADYVEMQLKGKSNIRPERIFITHTGCEKRIVDIVRKKIAENYKFDEVIETRASGTITSHCGKNTLGILFIEK